jgi:outer membrane immunogenic protein
MKKLAIAFSALAIGTVTASAADLAPRYTKAPPPAPIAIYNWTGFYIGGNVGYGWGENTGGGYSSFVDFLGGLGSFFAAGGNVLPNLRPTGILGGGQIGYNWQVAPSWVLGVVADIQAADIKTSGVGAASIGAFANITESKSVKTDWFGTVRGRAGFAVNNVLFYGTGGLAYGEVKARTSFNDPSFGGGPLVFAGSNKQTRTGWAAGAGIEWGFAPNWTAGFEYLFIDLGNLTVTETQVSGPANATTFTSVSRFRDNIARVLVNYKFGGPIVAKY